ncbi:GDP-L-fucose synthase family protein [Minwuia thermotolerans]|uniref:GDP-L-fucose synthase n=1 Tax=Minwuia thermotolerans TaxID=2056226 RepID=A0A2M9FW07_9PROT|nr:GDP-L-fucose synthase [Minwuia thermotolerans]PJK27623.1 GDP-fucose synthetase [Minwuia thermotolerans]
MTAPGRDDPIYVAGHRGLVGSAVLRDLEAAGYRNIITRASWELDLREQQAVRDFFGTEKPAWVVCAAAKVGGIVANNDYPGEFIHDNLAIQTNVIENCRAAGVRKLIYLGSTCIYPKMAPQPIREEHLLTGPLEPTNEAYAIAKIAGLKMCEAYRKQYGLQSVTLMATNLYGPGDNFDLERSHVIPALMRKAHEAKLAGAPAMEVWGTGSPLREFLHVDDMASAVRFCLENDVPHSMVNVGTGDEISIADLTRLICEVVGFDGELRFDTTKPDGTPRKLADSSRLRGLGWRPAIGLREGLAATYDWMLKTVDLRLNASA